MYHGCSNCREVLSPLWFSKKRKKEEEDEEQKEEEEEKNKKLTLLKLRHLKEGTRALGKWQCLAGCWYL